MTVTPLGQFLAFVLGASVNTFEGGAELSSTPQTSSSPPCLDPSFLLWLLKGYIASA